jgi:hypothetical protein
MGEFAALSGVVGASQQQVADVIREYVKSGVMKEQLPKRDRGRILAEGDRVTVLYPAAFMNWDDLSRVLSERLGRPVFSFHIHDGDLWMFLLFRGGQQISQFNAVPQYWEELPHDELARWAGDPEVTAAAAGVPADELRPYLRPWGEDDMEEASGRARPDDQFARGDAWQLVDFMKRLGFEYPIGQNGEQKGEAFNMAR